MFGIILKNYLSSMLWHKYDLDILCRHENYYCKYMYCLYTGKREISAENITFYFLKSVQNINNSSLNKMILYDLVGHNLVQLIYN